MTHETQTSRQELVVAVNDARRLARAYTAKLEELGQGIREILEALPEGLDPATLDLAALHTALDQAQETYQDTIHCASLKDIDIRLNRALNKADCHLEYLTS